MTLTPLEKLIQEARACTVCAAHLPHGPRPILRAAASARVLIIGQAPGRRVHETGIPWNDPSGDRLRQWLALSRDDFYDERRIAIVPTGLCFPGTGRSGDLPPRPECAPLWHPPLRRSLPNVRLTLLIGQYAQDYTLGPRRKRSLTETVAAFREYLPDYLPLPHPSPRNLLWLRKNEWFERELLPELLLAVRSALSEPPGGTGAREADS